MKLPKFSLRDLFWLTLLAALACAWWMDRWQLVREREVLAEAEKSRLRGEVLAVFEKKGLVEISLGRDDGVGNGQILQVYRGNQCLGEITIKVAEPDRSVGEIDRKTQTGPIRGADKVLGKISSSNVRGAPRR